MTKKELLHAKSVLERIKGRTDGMGRYGKVQLAISFIEKDLALREAQRDHFKDMYEDLYEGM